LLIFSNLRLLECFLKNIMQAVDYEIY